MRALLAVGLAAMLSAAGCSGSAESESAQEPEAIRSTPASPQQAPPAQLRRGKHRITPLRSVPPAENLPSFTARRIASADFPAGLAAAPDGRLFYSELYGGEIRVIRRDGTVDPRPWADVNAIYKIRWEKPYHGGLTGIAFDPEFAKNRFVYVVTQVPSKRNNLPSLTYVLRFKEVAGRGRSPKLLLTIRAKVFDNVYSLVFGPDGMLYVPSGFLGRSRPEGEDPLTDPRGKILRVTRDGKPPGDNPFGGRAPRVWASGVKNAFDLAFFPGLADAAVAGESGAAAHDEINLLMPGHDYGYPEHQGFTRARGVTPPMLDYGTNNTSPVGIIHYSGNRYPSLRGRFLMCENHGNGLLALRIDRSDPGRLRNLTPILPQCTLDIVQMPDGSVVFSDSGSIYRLTQR